VQVGPYLASRPLHFVRPIVIEGMPTHDTEIDRDFGTPNGRSVWDAITTAGGSSVQSATAAFVAGDVNRIISVYGAGTGGGTYYDFISAVPDGTHATLTATTPVARNSTTDPKGVKAQVVGDWDRVVTDAAITTGTAVLTSATAAFTDNDIGTEVVIAGAGHGGQALRAAIKSRQSASQVTIVGLASASVSGARCAVGVNFGDLVTFHVSGCGLKALSLYDRTTGQNRIGSAFKALLDDGLTGSGAHVLEDVQFGNVDTAGAWEHAIDCDGSWNQTVGPGVRQVALRDLLIFGTRRPTETIRLASAVHWWFTGGGIGGAAPTTIPQGVLILDPFKTSGGSTGSADVHFAGVEAIAGYYYCEGQYCTFHGGRLGGGSSFAVSGRVSIELSAASDSCSVVTVNVDTRASQELDSGTNNVIRTNRRPFIFSDSSGVEQFQLTTAGRLQFAGDANAALYRPAASLLQTVQNFCAANTLGVGPGAAGSSPTATVDVAVSSTSSATLKLRTASWGSLQITANGTSPGAVVIQTTNATPLQLGANGVNWLGITTGGDVIAGVARRPRRLRLRRTRPPGSCTSRRSTVCRRARRRRSRAASRSSTTGRTIRFTSTTAARGRRRWR
jgi:hypothetical protein